MQRTLTQTTPLKIGRDMNKHLAKDIQACTKYTQHHTRLGNYKLMQQEDIPVHLLGLLSFVSLEILWLG